ncbi:MAG: globin family protein [Bauldia litoralis]
MTPEQIQRVRESWTAVTPIADTAADLFYQRLFEIDPTTRPLFGATDMAAQRTQLVAALAAVVAGADRPEELVPTLEALGRRHVAYGVEDRHYDSVGAALIWTLEQGLGDGFTEAVREAWTAAYALVSGVMREAARDATRSAA